MSKFELSSEVDSEKIFLVNLSDIEGRIDPVYYKLKHKYSFNAVKLSNLLNDVFQGQVQGTQEQQAIKVLKVKNLDLFGNIDFDDVTYTNDMNDRKILKKGDIITPFRGQTIFTNKFAFFDSNEIVTIDNNLGVIRLDSKKIIPKFFRYYISSKIGFNEILKNVGGAGIPALTKDIIANIDVPILSFKKQQTIIDIMDNAYLQKQQKEQEAKELLDSIDGYLLDELGITLPEVDNSLEKRIFEINFSEISGNRFDSEAYLPFFKKLQNAIRKSKYKEVSLKNIIYKIERRFRPIENEEYNYIQLGSIGRDSSEVLKPLIIKLPEIPSRAQQVVKSGEILFSIANPQWGTHIIVNECNDNFVASSGFIILNSNENNQFIVEVLRSSIYKKLYEKYLTGSGLFLNISTKDLLSLKIPLPPIEKQNEIAEHIQAIRDKAKQLQDEAKKVLDEAKIEVEKLILSN